MIHKLIFSPLIILLIASPLFPQRKQLKNDQFLKNLNSTKQYTHYKDSIVIKYKNLPSGKWGEFVKGVDIDLITSKKIIALTFDACGGKHGNKYDKELIAYLRKEKIPATLFITGKWIDDNYQTFNNLANDSLFEIENHGFNHQPCSLDGDSEYGIKGTSNIADAFDEIDANACKIKVLTGRRPIFYRSATAYIDEGCAKMAHIIGVTPIGFDVLSGDAIPFTPTEIIVTNVITNIKPGAIVIMHFNHPKWNTFESLEIIIPKLREMGYSFTKLKDFPLKGKE